MSRRNAGVNEVRTAGTSAVRSARVSHHASSVGRAGLAVSGAVVGGVVG